MKRTSTTTEDTDTDLVGCPNLSSNKHTFWKLPSVSAALGGALLIRILSAKYIERSATYPILIADRLPLLR